MVVTYAVWVMTATPIVELVTEDELVGAAEAAEILGVTTMQVHRLSKRDDFPKPVARLKAGVIWRRVDVERWATENSDRRPGRPPRVDR